MVSEGSNENVTAVTHILAYVGVGDEELSTQVIFGDDFMVRKSDGGDAGEDEIFRDFVRERLDGDEEDIGCADSDLY